MLEFRVFHNNQAHVMLDDLLITQHWLHVFFVSEIPSLQQRSEDIPDWIYYLLDWFNKHYFKDIQNADPIVVKALQGYAWPGNIRELENVIERAYILETSSVLRPESFPRELFSGIRNTSKVAMDLTQPLAEVRRQAVEHLERSYLKELLKEHKRLSFLSLHVVPDSLVDVLKTFSFQRFV